MYKRIILSAVFFMLANQVHAQSSVTLSGIIDSGISYKTGANATNGSQFAFGSGNLVTSRFIFSGVEDLGGGMSTVFKLESGFLSGTGALTNERLPSTSGNFLFDRGATVGLKHNDYGTVTFGRTYTPFVYVLFNSDASGFENFGSVANTIYQTLTGFTGVQYTWSNNAVTYTSPTIQGLKFSVMNSLGGTAGDFSNERVTSAAVYYSLGPVSLNSGYIDGKDPTGLTDNTVARAYSVFLTYNGTSYKIGVNLENFRDPATGSNQNYYSVGAQYWLTPAVEFVSDYTYLSDRVNRSRDGSFAKVGVNYFLSKSTDVYTEVGLSRNHSLGTVGIGSVFPSSPGMSQVGVVAGLRYFF